MKPDVIDNVLRRIGGQTALPVGSEPRRTVAAALVRVAPEPKIIAKGYMQCIEVEGGFRWIMTLTDIPSGYKATVDGGLNQTGPSVAEFLLDKVKTTAAKMMAELRKSA